MASSTWALQAVDGGGQDVTLSQITAWGAAGEITPVSLSSTLAPSAGVLGNLLLADSTTCTFSTATLAAPGFRLALEFATPVDVHGLRFKGMTAGHMLRHQLSGGTTVTDCQATAWGAGAWSPAPTIAPRWDMAPGYWLAQTDLGNREWRGLAMSANGSVILAAAYSGLLYVSKDGGRTWASLPAAGTRDWSSCAVSADGQVLLAVADQSSSSVWLSVDGGSTWAAVSGVNTTAYAACSMSGDGMTLMLAASANTGVIRLSKDRGTTWVTQTAAGSRAWRGCAVSHDAQVLVAVYWASPSQVVISRDAGATWSLVGSLRRGASCALSGDGRVILCGGASNGEVVVSEDTGITWRTERVGPSSGTSFYGVGVSGDGALLLAVGSASNGGAYVSTTMGVTWRSEPAAGLYIGIGAVPHDGLLVAVGAAYSALNGPLRMMHRGDPIYSTPPLRDQHITPDVLLRGEAAVADQGFFTVADVRAQSGGDREFGGRGRIYGTVKRKVDAVNVPLRRRVRLHRSRDGYLVRETWSRASDGYYEFADINPQYLYDVIAWDHAADLQSVIANDLVPEVLA